MAGSNSGFDAAGFREAIRFAMNMGLPNAVQERATFRWTTKKSYAVADPSDKPYNWTRTPSKVEAHPDVQIPVAVEFLPRPSGSVDTVIADFDEARAQITVLDDDFIKVKGADQVILGGNTYLIQYVGPPVGLFEVTVYTIYCTARDES